MSASIRVYDPVASDSEVQAASRRKLGLALSMKPITLPRTGTVIPVDGGLSRFAF